MDLTQCEQRPDGVWACTQCGFAYDIPASELPLLAARAPARFRRELRAADLSGIDRPVSSGSWTPRQYIAHLADWAEIIAGRVDRILSEDRPFIEDIDQDLIAVGRAYDTWDVATALDCYEAAMSALVTSVASGDASRWDRIGISEVRGELQLTEVVSDLLHELEHHVRDIKGTAGWANG